jgi:hypothetical protein
MIGQYENIGDIILRRPLLSWLRPLGRLHVYVGPAPSGYVRGLRLEADDIMYRSFIAWYAAGLAHAARGCADYVFKPGEIQLSLRGMKEHVGMLPLLAMIRARRGKVARLGSGCRGFAQLPRLLLSPSLALSQFVRWRDPATAAFLRTGGVMPDLAFGEGDPLPQQVASSQRRLLAVSMRGDRGPVPKAWIEAVSCYATTRGFEVVVLTQVLRDSQMSRHLATALSARLVDWDGTRHDEQEEALRTIYQQASAVISDRLHVLIAAYTHGALPLAVLTDGSTKIQRHFDVVRMPAICVNAAGLDSTQILAEMTAIEARARAIHAALGPLRQRLAETRIEVINFLMGQPARPEVGGA